MMAKKVLASTLNTAAGFAIVELQDRYVSSILLMLLLLPAYPLLSLLYRWRDPVHLFFTFVIPILPWVQVFDGVVSCLRTRTFDEVMQLMPGEVKKIHQESIELGESIQVAQKGDWTFVGHRAVVMPGMRMNWVIGVRNR